MAKRLSVKEMLEAARKGGPATPGSEAPAPDPAAAEPEEAGVSEVIVVRSAAPTPPANVPTAASVGRPLTLKEKLAAARGGGTVTPVPAASSPTTGSEEAAAPAVEGVKAVPPPAASLGRPLTLKEKLAAAKSGGLAPAASAGAPAAKAAKPVGAKPAATAKRELPPLDKITDPKDLAEALRQTGAKKSKEVEDAAKAKSAPSGKPAKEKESRPTTVLPKPTRAAALISAAHDLRRRAFFSVLGVIIIGWFAFTAAAGAFTVMLGRFMFPNVLAEPPSTIKVGLPTNYEPEAVNDRFKAEAGFWIVRSTKFNGQDVIYALQSVCTHLGCPPNWLAGEQKFKCPCHGSGFYISGINFEGPAPRPLERFKVSISDDGQMVVDKSQKFQQELGQWSDPDSYINA